MLGGRYLPPRLAELAARRGDGATLVPVTRLTGRQGDVLSLIAMGKSNKEIARDLNLSPATVKAHTAAVILVLGAANRTDAVYRARGLGLIAP